MSALSDKFKIQNLWSLNALTKLVTNLCNSLKESEMVSAKGHKGQLIWLIADDADQEENTMELHLNLNN
ncbi:hypothetical protein ACQVPY_15165 [Bacillus pretiosus]|uniref:hypothetical protein n=1 Tax=Bacillus pretiosus TaxID=2983392 RepID=UPI003D646D00